MPYALGAPDTAPASHRFTRPVVLLVALLVVSLGATVLVAIARADGRTAVLVTRDGSLTAAEQLLEQRMEDDGWDVAVSAPDAVTSDVAEDADVVVVSATVRAGAADATLSDTASGLVTWEASMFEDLGLTDQAVETVSADSVVILQRGSPLAGGLGGTVEIASAGTRLTGTRPVAQARVVAAAPNGLPTVFSLERGAPRADGRPAPGRRVALPFRDDGPAALTEDGWRLLRNALEWAAAGDGDTPVTAQPRTGPTSSPLAKVDGLAPPLTPEPAPTATAIERPRPTTSPESETTFVATFDGDPDAPTPWPWSGWDVAVHSRDTWFELEPMDAAHGPDCSPPPATHPISSHEDAVYNCKDHMMTAINASGYGVIYLTPDRMVDFSDGTGTVSWDMSTLRTSDRDWVDVWITPYEDNLQMPLEPWLPDLAGAPRNAVHVRMENADGDTRFQIGVYRDHVETIYYGTSGVGYGSFLEPSATRRDTFELRISSTHLTLSMPDYDFVWVDTEIDDLGWTSGVVQFGHHSYNPTKAYAGGTANTWHWDNLAIAPARQFQIIQADRRYVVDEEPYTVAFETPAPPDAHLRFTAMAESIEVSYDGGETYEPAQRPSQTNRNGLLFSNYWTPIPEGTRTVTIRGDKSWLYGWMAQDFTVWAR